ncbi:MAG: S46 family peptidase [Saprospiraceae bacterium]|nr:S46 family peptidase [Saprospiraceae bacterium]
MRYFIQSFLLVFLLSQTSTVKAGEGMWLPIFLKALNEQEMQHMGMKISAEDIYSVNKSSLKDAIVHFGGFCTGEIISDQGLILTNHHCGYSNIQSHSTIENNLLKDGYWSQSFDEELPNPGLFVTFIESIEDVTKKALLGTNDQMSAVERQSTIDKNLENIRAGYRLAEFHEIIIRPFYNGNQYFLFHTVKYNDVRLVGTPPESIGKFGADTDNWVFPRHTGDFSLFRVYAGPNNEPAAYSPDNKPFTPKHSLPISLDGVEEGDFTMVFGFPGRTNQYLPSPAVEQIINTLNPAKIEIRDKALKILDKRMRAEPEVRLKYASKFARVANYWKKWIGESQGLKSSNALKKKYTLEKEYAQNAPKDFKNIVQEFKTLYGEIEPYALARDFYSETTSRNIEILRQIRNIQRLVTTYEENGEEEYKALVERYIPYFENFYKDYEPELDQEVFAALTAFYVESLDKEFIPEELTREFLFMRALRDFNGLAKYMYSNSTFPTEEKFIAVLGKEPAEAVELIKKDPLYTLYTSWNGLYTKAISAPYNHYKTQIDSLQRLYMKGQMLTFKDKRFWPDANSTMRVTYGKVNGYNPRDAVRYLPFSYVEGIMEKYVPGDYEFDVPKKLVKLIETKNYGQYADETGSVPVCFIGTNHTTGGNSGSPAIDAYGNLIGLNFDRVWEGTMSDINYDSSICRNIMVDARYVLFLVDKLGGATRLIDEMKLVRPKTGLRSKK